MQRWDDSLHFRRRLNALSRVVTVAFSVLGLRLLLVQGFMGERYAQRADDNFLEERRRPPLRGNVLDTKRRPLAGNRPTYDLYLTPRFMEDGTLERVISLLELKVEDTDRLRQAMEAREGAARYRPIRGFRDMNRDQLARIETHKLSLPGVRVEASTHRTYPAGLLTAHAVGYMNQVTANELSSQESPNYVAGDLVGRFGLERLLESELRGQPGLESTIVDARGRRKADEEVEELGLTSVLASLPNYESLPGNTVVLSIDIALQEAAWKSLEPYPAGAVAAVEPDTGRILALVSKPAFDPNLMTGKLTRGELQRIQSDPFRPLIDRTVRENYFPGSIYKVVPAIAGLEAGLLDPHQPTTCKGWHRLGRTSFRCLHVHGPTAFHKSLVESCNVYYYELAEKVGMDRIARVAHDLGLGEPTGLGLNGEVGGFIPTKRWYKENWPEGFKIGFTLNAAIGQGNTKVTPLQMALAYAALGNGGRLMAPQLVKEIESAEGNLLERPPPKVVRRLAASAETLSRIKRALTDAVMTEKGTAYRARPRDGSAVAGKTGTAQVRKKTAGVPDRDHGWFAAFAPPQKPTIAVAVLIEHGGLGGKVAAPVAMELIRVHRESTSGAAAPPDKSFTPSSATEASR